VPKEGSLQRTIAHPTMESQGLSLVWPISYIILLPVEMSPHPAALRFEKKRATEQSIEETFSRSDYSAVASSNSPALRI
jgi:hypothetical protein